MNIRRILLASMALNVLFAGFADASAWTEPAPILRREGVVVSYRATVAGDTLVVEVTHAEGWHTYSMDNIDRARKRTGKDKPETELPTRIDVGGGLEVVGSWYQTDPKELSQPEIHWYTWGFEGSAYFAAKVRPIDGETATITINGQACNATSCSMVSDLKLEVPVTGTDASGAFDFSGLVQVQPTRAETD